MKALAGTAVPVPRMLHLSAEDSPIGRMFYVMDFVEGRIFWDPALPEAVRPTRTRRDLRCHERHAGGPARRRRRRRRACRFWPAGQLFRTPAGALDRASTAPRETAAIADMDRLIVWLEAHMPADDGLVSLVHGDYRLDNMIFAPDRTQGHRRARLGTVDARPSLRRHRLSVHAMAAAAFIDAFAASAASTARRSACPPRRTMSRPIASGAASSGIGNWTFYLSLFLLPARGDLPGRLQARARRQRLEPGKGKNLWRGGEAAGRPCRATDRREEVSDGPL